MANDYAFKMKCFYCGETLNKCQCIFIGGHSWEKEASEKELKKQRKNQEDDDDKQNHILTK